MSIHDKTRCNTAILMAVHNGEKYLAEQIESILNQAYSKFDLIMQDDGSTDCSTKIIDRYCQKDSRIIRLDNIDNPLSKKPMIWLCRSKAKRKAMP